MTQDQHAQQDPTTQYPQPEFGEQQLEHPGLESEMDPKPDYGEDTYRGSGKLEGKAAIITGGDSGIGRAAALAFAREGADVLISYLESEEPDAQETVRAVEGSGHKAVAVPGDILMLIPGCSSFDMFHSFEHRGQVFRDAVTALSEEKTREESKV